MEAVKIYGERNSGTNYVESLVKKNLDIEILRYIPSQEIGKYLKYETLTGLLYELNKKYYLGWKHGKPKIKAINNYKERNLRIITITKNPYSFLLSLYKRPYHYKGVRGRSFLEFISSKWKTIIRDNCRERSFSSPVELWNVKNRSYLDLKDQTSKGVLNVRYEDVLMNPELVIDFLLKGRGDQLRKQDQFVNIEESTKGDRRKYEDYRTYYLEERWKSKLEEEAIRIINEQLDKELLKRFNYEEIQPTTKMLTSISPD